MKTKLKPSNNSYKIQLSIRMRPILEEFEDQEAWAVDKPNFSIKSL